MRIYRHNFKKDGEKVESKKWYTDIYLPDGRRRRLPLFEDEGLSRQYAEKIGDLISLKAGGEVPPVALQQWVNDKPMQFQKKLAEWGLISGARVAARSSLEKHLDDWREDMLSGGITKKQAEQNRHRAGRIFSEAGFRSLDDVEGGRVMLMVGRLQNTVHRKSKKTKKLELCKTGPASSHSKLHHLRACKQFTKWAFLNGRLTADPLHHLQIKNVRVENKRRPLTVEELSYLFAYLQTAPATWNVPGPERALVYELAVNTGLRRDEIKSLKRSSFDFERLFVRVEAKDTKNKKPALLPVKAALMDRIKAHLSGKLPMAAAFNVPEAAAKMLRKDMQEARKQWIEAGQTDPEEYQRRIEGDFLKAETHEGKVDFHSLRHTFGTLLAESGVHPKVAMDLMRHSDINLTLALYTHSNQEQATAAIDVLPDLNGKNKAAKQA
ncbi:MAG TPA: site-specific integrase [Anaerohalosphaeraceae bacterium]|nr:site-specific integrase [Anaerohalosphaeraceae bacterium]HRT51460.1 site-specific integrase [Anaerohalosphaeraceae bacterium]HRT87507.1 site-specific integrase [Anaerohalosphaeraceae bacterium]